MDKYLCNFEVMLIVIDGKDIFVVIGVGDVLELEYDVVVIGLGGNYVLVVVWGLMLVDLDVEGVVCQVMVIVVDICVYINGNLMVEVLG